MKVEVTCIACNKLHVIEVNSVDFFAWKHGELVQVAFPYLSDSDRELLVSHTCDKCWEEAFSEERWEDGPEEEVNS